MDILHLHMNGGNDDVYINTAGIVEIHTGSSGNNRTLVNVKDEGLIQVEEDLEDVAKMLKDERDMPLVRVVTSNTDIMYINVENIIDMQTIDERQGYELRIRLNDGGSVSVRTTLEAIFTQLDRQGINIIECENGLGQ
mgnify:FL=1